MDTELVWISWMENLNMEGAAGEYSANTSPVNDVVMLYILKQFFLV